MNESAGQATERTPDFIPGWFRRIRAFFGEAS
jgi:hypothetical protein